jgi:hypothetical protein
MADEQDTRKPPWGSRVPLMTPSYPLSGGMPGQMDWAGMKTRFWRWLSVLPRNIYIASQHKPTQLGYPGKFFDFDRKLQQMTRVPGPAGLSFSINRRLMDVLQMSHNMSLGEEQQQSYDFNIGTGTPSVSLGCQSDIHGSNHIALTMALRRPAGSQVTIATSVESEEGQVSTGMNADYQQKGNTWVWGTGGAFPQGVMYGHMAQQISQNTKAGFFWIFRPEVQEAMWALALRVRNPNTHTIWYARVHFPRSSRALHVSMYKQASLNVRIGTEVTAYYQPVSGQLAADWALGWKYRPRDYGMGLARGFSLAQAVNSQGICGSGISFAIAGLYAYVGLQFNLETKAVTHGCAFQFFF